VPLKLFHRSEVLLIERAARLNDFVLLAHECA